MQPPSQSRNIISGPYKSMELEELQFMHNDKDSFVAMKYL